MKNTFVITNIDGFADCLRESSFGIALESFPLLNKFGDFIFENLTIEDAIPKKDVLGLLEKFKAGVSGEYLVFDEFCCEKVIEAGLFIAQENLYAKLASFDLINVCWDDSLNSFCFYEKETTNETTQNTGTNS